MVTLKKHKDYPVHSFRVKTTINSLSNHIWFFRLPTVLLHLPALHFSCVFWCNQAPFPLLPAFWFWFLSSVPAIGCLTTCAGGDWKLRIPCFSRRAKAVGICFLFNEHGIRNKEGRHDDSRFAWKNELFSFCLHLKCKSWSMSFSLRFTSDSCALRQLFCWWIFMPHI